MQRMNPWLTGVALGITIGIGYAVCTLLFLAFPEAALAFLNSLFHGLEFRKLQVAGAFSLTGFAAVAVAMMVYGFLIGALFASVRNLLSR